MNTTLKALAGVLLIARVSGTLRADDVLWDNGIVPDNVTGTIVATPELPDVRVVDEFVVPDGAVWLVTGFRYVLAVDEGFEDGGITEVCLWADSGGDGPLKEIYAEPHSHAKRQVGFLERRRTWEFTAHGLELVLPPGTYWIGPELPEARGGRAFWVTARLDAVSRQGDLSWSSPDAGHNWSRADAMGWDGDYWHQAFQVLGSDMTRPDWTARGADLTAPGPTARTPEPTDVRESGAPAPPISEEARVTSGYDLLWDNDIVASGFMARAISPPAFPNIRVVDDFIVSKDGWLIRGLGLNVVVDAGWVSGPTLDFYIHADAGNRPGQRLVYDGGPFEKIRTGRQLFSRDEYHYWIRDLDVALEEGHYWVGFRNSEGSGAGTNYWNVSNGGQGAGTPGWFSLDAGQTWQNEGLHWDHGFEVRGLVGAGFTVAPFDFDVTRGGHVSGGIISLVERDDERLVVAALRPNQVSQPSVQVVVESTAGEGIVHWLSFRIEASTTLPAGEQAVQWIDLYDFDAGEWVRMDTREASSRDAITTVVVDDEPERFVDEDAGIVRARVSFYDPGLSIAGWFGQFDMMRWRIR